MPRERAHQLAPRMVELPVSAVPSRSRMYHAMQVSKTWELATAEPSTHLQTVYLLGGPPALLQALMSEAADDRIICPVCAGQTMHMVGRDHVANCRACRETHMVNPRSVGVVRVADLAEVMRAWVVHPEHGQGR